MGRYRASYRFRMKKCKPSTVCAKGKLISTPKEMRKSRKGRRKSTTVYYYNTNNIITALTIFKAKSSTLNRRIKR